MLSGSPQQNRLFSLWKYKVKMELTKYEGYFGCWKDFTSKVQMTLLWLSKFSQQQKEAWEGRRKDRNRSPALRKLCINATCYMAVRSYKKNLVYFVELHSWP